MANNQDRGANQGGSASSNQGQTGGQPAGGNVAGDPGRGADAEQGGQKGGKMPDDQRNKDWQRSSDAGQKGGQRTDEGNMGQGADETSEPGSMGGQGQRGGTQKPDNQR